MSTTTNLRRRAQLRHDSVGAATVLAHAKRLKTRASATIVTRRKNYC